MGQILAIDYGKARCGIAVTDDMQIIASGLETVPTEKIITFLKNYFSLNRVDEVVIGLPVDLRGNISEIETDIQLFIKNFEAEFPGMNVERYDERFTSKIASYYISQSGKNKSKDSRKG